ncbi:unnamed protein product, partial [Rotaria sp. Silwood1]
MGSVANVLTLIDVTSRSMNQLLTIIEAIVKNL